MRGQLAEQFYLFIQTPLAIADHLNFPLLHIAFGHVGIACLFIQTPLDRQGMASLQSNSTFSFKHHSTDKAWPAYRAILPFHSNTT